MASPNPTTVKAATISAAACAIIAAVCTLEGGLVDNPRDPGGATNHGITQAVARAHGYAGPMAALSLSLAQSIYYQDYIVKPGFAPWVDVAPAVAEKLVDAAVNTGPQHPAIWLQTTLKVLGQPISVDGKVGPNTFQAYQNLVKQRGSATACQLVVKSLDAQQGAYYLQISQATPSLQQFTAGWMLNRVGNVPLSHCG